MTQKSDQSSSHSSPQTNAQASDLKNDAENSENLQTKLLIDKNVMFKNYNIIMHFS